MERLFNRQLGFFKQAIDSSYKVYLEKLGIVHLEQKSASDLLQMYSKSVIDENYDQQVSADVQMSKKDKLRLKKDSFWAANVIWSVCIYEAFQVYDEIVQKDNDGDLDLETKFKYLNLMQLLVGKLNNIYNDGYLLKICNFSIAASSQLEHYKSSFSVDENFDIFDDVDLLKLEKLLERKIYFAKLKVLKNEKAKFKENFANVRKICMFYECINSDKARCNLITVYGTKKSELNLQLEMLTEYYSLAHIKYAEDLLIQGEANINHVHDWQSRVLYIYQLLRCIDRIDDFYNHNYDKNLSYCYDFLNSGNSDVINLCEFRHKNLKSELSM